MLTLPPATLLSSISSSRSCFRFCFWSKKVPYCSSRNLQLCHLASKTFISMLQETRASLHLPSLDLRDTEPGGRGSKEFEDLSPSSPFLQALHEGYLFIPHYSTNSYYVQGALISTGKTHANRTKWPWRPTPFFLWLSTVPQLSRNFCDQALLIFWTFNDSHSWLIAFIHIKTLMLILIYYVHYKQEKTF